MELDAAIRLAITELRLVEFMYRDLPRIAEPHVYGVTGQKAQLLVYQIGGESSSGRLPDWRRVDLDVVAKFRVLEERFAGRRPTPSGRHSYFDQTILVVR